MAPLGASQDGNMVQGSPLLLVPLITLSFHVLPQIPFYIFFLILVHPKLGVPFEANFHQYSLLNAKSSYLHHKLETKPKVIDKI